MFADATAIVDILNREPEADTFAEAIEQHAGGLTSAIAVFEATLALCRIRHVTIEEAAADVHEFMSVCGGSTYANHCSRDSHGTRCIRALWEGPRTSRSAQHG